MNLTPITIDQVAPELRSIVHSISPSPVDTKVGRWFTRIAIKLFIRGKSHKEVQVGKRTINTNVMINIYTPKRVG